MINRDKLIKIGKSLGFITLALLLFVYASNILEAKSSRSRFADFYEQEADFDVLFFGASHVYSGIFPMELWKDYGIVSYNMSGEYETIPVSYYMVKNALEHTSPKLIVMDCNLLSDEDKVSLNPSFVHSNLDHIPFGTTKIEAVCDLLKGSGRSMEYLFDFILYHDRWDDLGMNDFHPNRPVEKGGVIRYEHALPAQYEEVGPDEVYSGDSCGVQYLKKIIELCQSKGVDVLLTYLPFPADENCQREANRAAEIASEYGVSYINFLKMDVVDYDTDCRDSNSHLNGSGGRKVTSFIGKYIMDNYSIQDQRGNASYDEWNDDYAEYKAYKIRLLSGQKEPRNYMMLLYDKHFSYCVYFDVSNEWTENEVYRSLLANIGINSDGFPPESRFLAVVDNVAGTADFLAEGQQEDTSFGSVAFCAGVGTGGESAQINDNTCLDIAGNTSFGVAVVDNEFGQVVSTAQFAGLHK